jgi:hypothetical protein
MHVFLVITMFSCYSIDGLFHLLPLLAVPLSRRAGLTISKTNEEMFYSEAKITALLILKI